MSDDLFRAVAVLHKGDWSGASDAVSLDYAGRFLRRRRLTTDAGRDFLADLPETVSLDDGDALRLEDGTVVAVRPAPEDMVEVRGADLARLAWHIGNRHTPCQIAADRLVIRRDHVIEAMLVQLGAALTPVTGPFRPEGGAYGHGRTLGHDHGPGPGPGAGVGHPSDHHADAAHDHGHLRVHTHGSHRGSGFPGDEDPEGEA